MSSGTPSESETLLASTPDIKSSYKSDGGKDIPVFIDSFKRNVFICKILLGLGLAGSLGVEIWCMIQSFVKDHSHYMGPNLENFMKWEKITNIACVVLVFLATVLYLVSLGKHPIYESPNGSFRNIEIHKTLTQMNFIILLAVLILHYLPATLQTYYTRTGPPSPYDPYWASWVRSAVELFSLLAVGCMRRIPELYFEPMKMGTGFGVNQEIKRAKKPGKEDANVLDRAGCPIIEFLFLIYVAKILKRSMTSDTLILDDLPHLAEEVRKTGYRHAMSEKEGAIKLDDDDVHNATPKQKLITSWELVMILWKGRAWVICTNIVYEAIPNFFGLLQLVALRELIDSFADGPEGDKSYAYLMCWLLLIGQAAEVIVAGTVWLRENYLLHLPVRMVLASMLFSKILRTADARGLEAKKDSDEASKKQGRSQVMNLLTIDTGAIASLAIHIWHVTNALVNLVIGFWLLYSMLGLSAIIGIGCIPILSSFTAILAKFIYYCDKSLARARDTRTGAVKEFLAGIKVIKLNNFEDYYVRDINRVREAEVKWQRYRYTLGTLWNVIGDQLPVISILVTFIFHTKVFGHNLNASTAFVALTVFNRVKESLTVLPATLQALLQAKVSLDRLTTYLNQPEIDPPMGDSSGRIICQQATIGWPTEDKDDSTPVTAPFTLKGLDFEPPQGQMTIVCGPLGSGKTLLLRGLLGEARILDGTVLAPRTAPDAVPLNGGEIQRNWTTESWLIDSVAYAPQQAYIRHGSIRDNICFGQPFWKERYKEALRQSALLSDLDIMESGDLTEVGEHGTTLSGGQKARVNLARCIYSRAKTVYMDDILSAVDAHTAQYIFTECFQGSLLKGRTFVLVTHHVALCLPAAEFLVFLDNGNVVQACPASEAQISAIPAAPPRPDEGHTEEAPDEDDEPDQAARQIYKTEHTASGRVASSHYWLIFKSVGGFWYWVIFAILFSVTRLADIAQSYVLERWSSDSDPSHLDRNLVNYGLFVSAAVIIGALRWVWLYGVGSTGFVNSMSRKIHFKMVNTLVGAPLSYFETTPTGRLMNVFAQDVNRIDAYVSDDVGRTIMSTLEVLSSILIVCIQTPVMAIIILVGALPFYWLSGVLGKVRAELRRLTAVAGSPLITLYHDAIDGVVMIRAFGSNELMQASMLALINRERNATLADFGVFNLVRAIVQTITSIIVAGTGFALVRTDLSPSQAGFILSFAITASRGLFTLLERYSSLEQTFVSAERIEHYINGPPQESTEGDIPEKTWPSKGGIQVEGFSVRYGIDLPDVLHEVSFQVEPGQRVGLVGATGSGKSTLALSLFRAIEGHEGRIVIDGQDISKLALHELRRRLNMVAQDGSLGSGTLRDALDITRQKDDYEIYEALKRVHLLPENLDEAELKDNPFANLDTFVAVEGANFSAGQKQLLCLARALLKKSKILVMDEATSSVDFEMDSKITETIKECFAGTTMLVIAHRLATIMHYDRVLVLDKGRVLEYGKPVDLMRNQTSAFHKLCMAQGEEEYEKLMSMASED